MKIYHNAGKQILERGKHFADARDEKAAELVASVLNYWNRRYGLPDTTTTNASKEQCAAKEASD